MNEQAYARYRQTRASLWEEEGHAEWITVREITRYLPVTQQNINYAIRQGRLPAIQDQGKWRIRNQDFARYWNTQRSRSAPRPRRSTIHAAMLAWCEKDHPEWVSIADVCQELPISAQSMTILLRKQTDLGIKQRRQWYVKSETLRTYWLARWG